MNIKYLIPLTILVISIDAMERPSPLKRQKTEVEQTFLDILPGELRQEIGKFSALADYPSQVEKWMAIDWSQNPRILLIALLPIIDQSADTAAKKQYAYEKIGQKISSLFADNDAYLDFLETLGLNWQLKYFQNVPQKYWNAIFEKIFQDPRRVRLAGALIESGALQKEDLERVIKIATTPMLKARASQKLKM